MSQFVTCPACGESLDVSSFEPGVKIACGCGQKMRLPTASQNRTILAKLEAEPDREEAPRSDREPPARKRRREREEDEDDRDERDDRDRRRDRGRRDRRDDRVYCRRCDRRVWTRYRKRISQTGWILVCVGILFWPLIIVGLLMNEEIEECDDCGRVLDVRGGGFG